MKKIFLVSSTSVWLAACASSPQKNQAGALTAEPARPSYSEKVGVVTADSWNGLACPADKSFLKEDWRKVVGYANACVKARNWSQLDSIGNHLAKSAPLTPWGAYYMALVAGSRKDYPRAQWLLELALKKAPSEGLFHYELGRLFWETGDDAGVIREMKAASDLNPSLTEAHFVMGQLALRRDDQTEARKLLQRVLARDSRHSGALLASAQNEINARDFSKAELYLVQAVAANPQSTKARLGLAQVQELHLNKMHEALQAYRDLKQLASERKLDEKPRVNVDEKINLLEKSLSQVKGGQQTVRSPTGERQVKK